MQVWDSSLSTQPGLSLKGFEVMNMIHKGQVNGIAQGDSVAQADFIALLFGVVVA